jgi:hypothetical protein
MIPLAYAANIENPRIAELLLENWAHLDLAVGWFYSKHAGGICHNFQDTRSRFLGKLHQERPQGEASQIPAYLTQM